jgi:copper chaperone CopZ
MRFFFLILVFIGVFSLPARAHHVPTHPNDVTVKVDGMVCDFCAQSIAKLFQKKPEVDKVNINLDSKEVAIDFKTGVTLPNEEINKVIDYAGYSVAEIIR